MNLLIFSWIKQKFSKLAENELKSYLTFLDNNSNYVFKQVKHSGL